MSQEIREKALSAAVATAAESGADAVIAAAKQFEAYILGTATTAAKPAAAKPAAAKPAATTAAKPAAAKPAAAKPAAATAAKPAATKKAEVDPDAKKLVGDKVNELLRANKREEAVALLGSFDGAQSATGIVAQGDEVIQSFLTQADEILTAAEGGLAD